MPFPIENILNKNPVPIRERLPGLEKGVTLILDKSVHREPAKRIQNANVLLKSLSS